VVKKVNKTKYAFVSARRRVNVYLRVRDELFLIFIDLFLNSNLIFKTKLLQMVIFIVHY